MTTAPTEVWVVDRFNQGEIDDFRPYEIYDSMQALEVFQTLDGAKRATEASIRQEIEEMKEDEPEMELESWTPTWKLEERRHRVLEAPHDGSIYTIRPIPLLP